MGASARHALLRLHSIRYVCQTVSEFFLPGWTDGSFHLSQLVTGWIRSSYVREYSAVGRSHERARSFLFSGRRAGGLRWLLAVVTSTHALTRVSGRRPRACERRLKKVSGRGSYGPVWLLGRFFCPFCISGPDGPDSGKTRPKTSCAAHLVANNILARPVCLGANSLGHAVW